MRSIPRFSILGLNYSPETTGIAPYTASLARGMLLRGMKVRVVTTHAHYPEWRFREGAERWSKRESVDGVPVTRLKHYLPRKPEGLNRLWSELSFGARLALVRWGAPDVVVLLSPALFSTALAIVRARLSVRRPSIVVWVQDLYSLGVTETGAGGGAVARIMTFVESRALRAASRVVVIHSRFAAYVTDVLGVDPARVDVVRNWTHLGPTPVVDTSATRERHGWRAEETIVLHAGNMGAKQGLENVVDAARLADQQELPLRFVLLGNGNQRQSLEDYARGVTRLQFVNSLEDAGFQAALASADILLVNEKPGVSEMAVPSKLTSYFSSGRPVIAATDLGGVTAEEVVAAHGGLVVRAGNGQALVDACLELREDRERARELGESGQRYRRQVLGQEAAIDRFAAILQEEAASRHRVGS